MNDDVTKLKAELYEKQNEIDTLKRALVEKDEALRHRTEALAKAEELLATSTVEKQKSINELLHICQDKDGENRRLIEQRGRRDQRIDNLERQVRNQKRDIEAMARQHNIAQRFMDLTAQLLTDVYEASGSASLPAELRERVRRASFPQPPTTLIDFAIQLRTWSDSDPEFKKKLEDMGFGAYESIVVDLTKPLVDPEEEPAPIPPNTEQPTAP